MHTTSPMHRRRQIPQTAPYDCRCCIARKQECDRSRPHCRNCQKSGTTCTGFAVQLSWQPGFSSTRKPVKRRRTYRRLPAHSSGPREFEFVNEYVAEIANDHCPSATTRAFQSPAQSLSDEEISGPGDCDVIAHSLEQHEAEQRLTKDLLCYETGQSQASVDEDTPLPRDYHEARQHTWSPGPNCQYAADTTALDPFSNKDCSVMSSRDSVPSDLKYGQRLLTIPPRILYESQVERLEPVFERCETLCHPLRL